MSASQSIKTTAPPPAGNADRGKKLVAKFECNRCHDGTGLEPASFVSHCFRCHQDIESGKFKPRDPSKLARWKKNVAHVQHVPSLAGAATRFRVRWLVGFLQKPTDLRPNLSPSMPRLALSEQAAADIAAYLTRGKQAPAGDALAGAEASRGRALMEAKGCGTCHRMTGAPKLPAEPPSGTGQAALELAPDLRFARERYEPGDLVHWLKEPDKLKPGTLMPNFKLSDQEAKDIAAYLVGERLTPLPAPRPVKPLPRLERPVKFAEVDERVFSKICAHCHGNPDIAGGDGGPGNTGGFGFQPRHLDLSNYSGVASGMVRDDGERHSIFLPLADGTPRLVASLLARRAEVAGTTRADVRGMPLGMPPMSLEDIQLVDTWIAQGRPR